MTHQQRGAAEQAALRASEETALADITSQARGDGRWMLRTRHGRNIAILERQTRIGAHGRTERITLDGARFPVRTLEAGIFIATLSFLGTAAVEQSEYVRFIRGAHLIPIHPED